ncbi:hypothetical protein TNCV_383001 [Trichonephila clavipes]|nr:hypothetical protein TNCV_383001 [Trichonephila clavipes]
MKHSPFSYARTLNLPSSDVEPHSLSFTGSGLEFDGIYFHDQLLTSVTKSSEIPALVNQLTLETINGIPQSSLKIYTDGSRGHSIHFQWIPSHVGIEGNERADFLARTAAVEGVSPRGNLTFSEISTISKLELNRQIKLHPVMHDIQAKEAADELAKEGVREALATSNSLTYLELYSAKKTLGGHKTHPICPKSNIEQASPTNILRCLDLSYDDLQGLPMLVYDFGSE